MKSVKRSSTVSSLPISLKWFSSINLSSGILIQPSRVWSKVPSRSSVRRPPLADTSGSRYSNTNMISLIATFYVASLAIVGMFLLKRHEVKTGHPTLLSRLGAGSDHFFKAAFQAVEKGVKYVNRKTFIAMTQWIAYHVLLRVRHVYV